MVALNTLLSGRERDAPREGKPERQGPAGMPEPQGPEREGPEGPEGRPEPQGPERQGPEWEGSEGPQELITYFPSTSKSLD